MICWIWWLVGLFILTTIWLGLAALGTIASVHFSWPAKFAVPFICIAAGTPMFLIATIWFFAPWIPSRHWKYIQNRLPIFKLQQ